MNFKINIINKPATINRNGFVDIKGFEGLYMINRKGEIISIGRQVGIEDKVWFLLGYALQEKRYQESLLKKTVQKNHSKIS